MMKNTLLYIWQLPQNICGFVYTKFIQTFFKSYAVSSNRAKKLGVQVNTQPFSSAVSLGNYIIVNEKYLDNKITLSSTIKHECGHCKQSVLLGPLYLPIIGIPSIVWNCLHRLPKFKGKDYYSFYTEKWANELVE